MYWAGRTVLPVYCVYWGMTAAGWPICRLAAALGKALGTGCAKPRTVPCGVLRALPGVFPKTVAVATTAMGGAEGSAVGCAVGCGVGSNMEEEWPLGQLSRLSLSVLYPSLPSILLF